MAAGCTLAQNINGSQSQSIPRIPSKASLSLTVGNGVFVFSDGDNNLFYSVSGNNWKQAQISTRMQHNRLMIIISHNSFLENFFSDIMFAGNFFIQIDENSSFLTSSDGIHWFQQMYWFNNLSSVIFLPKTCLLPLEIMDKLQHLKME